MISQARSLYRPPVRGHFVTDEYRHALFLKNPSKKPDNYWQILALVVGRDDDGIFVGIGRKKSALHGQRGGALERIHSDVATCTKWPAQRDERDQEALQAAVTVTPCSSAKRAALIPLVKPRPDSASPGL